MTRKNIFQQYEYGEYGNLDQGEYGIYGLTGDSELEAIMMDTYNPLEDSENETD